MTEDQSRLFDMLLLCLEEIRVLRNRVQNLETGGVRMPSPSFPGPYPPMPVTCAYTYDMNKLFER